MFQGRWFFLVRRAYAANSDTDSPGSSPRQAALPAAGANLVPLPIQVPNLAPVPPPAPPTAPPRGPLSIPYLANASNILRQGPLNNIFGQPAPAVVQQAVAERMAMLYSIRQHARRFAEWEVNINPSHNPVPPPTPSMTREQYRDFWLAQDDEVYATFMDDLHGHITVAFTLAYHLQQAEDELTRMRGEEDRFLRRIRVLNNQLVAGRVMSEADAVVMKRLSTQFGLLLERLNLCEELLKEKGGMMPPSIQFDALNPPSTEVEESGERTPKIPRQDDGPSTSGVNPLIPDDQANSSGENVDKSPRSDREKK